MPENQDTSYIPTPHESTKMLILVRISLPGRFTLTRGCSMKAMRALIKQDLVALVKLRVGTLTMRTLKAVIQITRGPPIAHTMQPRRQVHRKALRSHEGQRRRPT